MAYIYKAYRNYCSSLNNLNNELSVDIIKADSNRVAFTYMIDAESKFTDIEEES